MAKRPLVATASLNRVGVGAGWVVAATKSHFRPHVSKADPYSDAGYKTFKYRPDFPDRFGSSEDDRRQTSIQVIPTFDPPRPGVDGAI